MSAPTVNQARLALWLTLPSLSDAGLTRLGIDRIFANRAGGLAWSRITTFGRGFDLSPSGMPAVIGFSSAISWAARRGSSSSRSA
ncbi:MAG: hypothetical protein IH991_02240 [Planctomycetes bacterium]|nr:hypothetical protein [Planctomycetota bacterium]